MSETPKILVTGTSGHLGALIIDELLKLAPAGGLIAAARRPEALAAYTARGIESRIADYNDPSTLAAALQGVDRLLLVSSSEIGQRAAQHHNVIQAARQAGVKFVAYTSLLHADTSELALAKEHLETETEIAASGIPYALLRNSWYIENYDAAIRSGAESGAIYGSAGDGLNSAAARIDFAEAAAKVIAAPSVQSGAVYELAGDSAFTMRDLAAAIASAADRDVNYVDLPEAEYSAALQNVGLPKVAADIYAQSDTGLSHGALFDDSRTLSKLIGRPTTSLANVIAATLDRVSA